MLSPSFFDDPLWMIGAFVIGIAATIGAAREFRVRRVRRDWVWVDTEWAEGEGADSELTYAVEGQRYSLRHLLARLVRARPRHGPFDPKVEVRLRHDSKRVGPGRVLVDPERPSSARLGRGDLLAGWAQAYVCLAIFGWGAGAALLLQFL